MKAEWNGTVIAESDSTIFFDNCHYFPMESLNKDFFTESDHKTTCFWKGSASYFNITVNGDENKNSAWYYPSTKPKAKEVENYVAFWKGVLVS